VLIGKAGPATTSISTADAASITVRGKDLCTDLMGRLSFTSYFYLLLTGREPTEQQTWFLDLLLVAIAEHGLVPTNQAARMTYAADPASLQGAVAAGILGCGTVVLGTAELCARFPPDAPSSAAAIAAESPISATATSAPSAAHFSHCSLRRRTTRTASPRSMSARAASPPARPLAPSTTYMIATPSTGSMQKG
jgi:hypothetical protein